VTHALRCAVEAVFPYVSTSYENAETFADENSVNGSLLDFDGDTDFIDWAPFTISFNEEYLVPAPLSGAVWQGGQRRPNSNFNLAARLRL